MLTPLCTDNVPLPNAQTRAREASFEVRLAQVGLHYAHVMTEQCSVAGLQKVGCNDREYQGDPAGPEEACQLMHERRE